MNLLNLKIALTAALLATSALSNDSVRTTYFPTSVGTTWIYELTVLGQEGVVTYTIVEPYGLPDAQEFKLKIEARLGKRTVISYETYKVSSTGITQIATARGRMEPGLMILRVEAKEGDTWKWHGRIFGKGDPSDAGAQVSILRTETLITPAGRYQTILSQVEMKITSDREEIVIPTRYWFAEGIGWVKIETDLPGGTLTLVLKSFKNG